MNRNHWIAAALTWAALSPLAQAQASAATPAITASAPAATTAPAAATERTRASVVAELAAARAAGEMDFGLREIFPDAVPARPLTAAK